MRSNGHLLEINIRQWIRQLNQKYDRKFSLASIPDGEWQRIKEHGLDAVWLLGIWQTSSLAREISRKDTDLKRKLKKFHPDFKLEDIDASPHAVYDYTLDSSLGKPDELFKLKEKLNSLDLKLILDFYSNHVAVDHLWVREYPHCFVKATQEDLQKHPDWFFKPEGSNHYLAYGRDPNFPPWRETAQLNHFSRDTRKLITDTLLKISDFCDGVRCNKVMLTLNDIFGQNWGAILNRTGFKTPSEEFWPRAIEILREKNPYFIFLAEVYWGLEWRVQQMGFDYTYDQVLYDRLRWTMPADIKAHLKAERLYQKRSLRFIDNHNEPPSATAFGRERSIAAAAVISTLEGLRLYHYKQLEGVRVKPPIRYLKNECRNDSELKKTYEKILKEVDHPAYHGGEWTLLDACPASREDQTFNNLLCWHWVQQNTLKLVVVNYSNSDSHGRVLVKAKSNGDHFRFKDELSGEVFTHPLEEVSGRGLYVKLPPYGVRMLTLEF
jgi:hypothetical protein